MGFSGTQNRRITVIYMRRRNMFEDGGRMVEHTRGDNVFDLVVKPIQKSEDWNENDRKKQKYKNLSRSSLDDVMQFKI